MGCCEDPNGRVDDGEVPRWMGHALRLAAVYNVLWGAWVVLMPGALFDWAGMAQPNYPQIWQCVGMIVGVYGVGYWIAARDPVRHWVIVLVGLLGKVLGPIGFARAVWQGELPLKFGATILSNDLVWWVPFGLILLEALRARDAVVGGAAISPDGVVSQDALRGVRTGDGRTLFELSLERPQLVVLLRHFGCTFCREALADLGKSRKALVALNVGVVIVHQSSDARAAEFFEGYGLGDVPRVSDPGRAAYRAFGLGRGRGAQLLSPGVWVRGALAFFKGHGMGRLEGDGFQMPGVFIVSGGKVLDGVRHRTAADRVDVMKLASCCNQSPVMRGWGEGPVKAAAGSHG